MNWLARLRALENSSHMPRDELSKLPKAPSDSFDSVLPKEITKFSALTRPAPVPSVGASGSFDSPVSQACEKTAKPAVSAPPAPWDASDWREYFEERVAVAMIDGEQPESEARRIAWACCVTHWRTLNPIASAPSHCAHCDRPDEPGNIVPFGTGSHVWLHGGCWEPWDQARQAEAERALRQTINGKGNYKGNYNVERD